MFWTRFVCCCCNNKIPPRNQTCWYGNINILSRYVFLTNRMNSNLKNAWRERSDSTSASRSNRFLVTSKWKTISRRLLLEQWPDSNFGFTFVYWHDSELNRRFIRPNPLTLNIWSDFVWTPPKKGLFGPFFWTHLDRILNCWFTNPFRQK